MKQKSLLPIVSVRMIERRILFLRGEKVLVDSDLSELYGVTTKRLNEAVARNIDIFPRDFMFQLNREETENLRSQIATSSSKHGGRRYLPYVFTEYGALMAANILRSERAIQVSIEIVRTFVKLRELLATHADLAHKLNEMEKKNDKQFAVVFDAICALMNPSKQKIPRPRHGKFGFQIK